MSKRYLLDTNVLIDYLRGLPQSIKYLENLKGTVFISSLTVAELFAGVKEGKTRTILENFINAFEIIPITPAIAKRGGLYRRDFGKSHGADVIDAIIAASSEDINAIFVTLNKKHFPMLKKIHVPYEYKT
jgi:predicted nucleic acid-binding protein